MVGFVSSGTIWMSGRISHRGVSRVVLYSVGGVLKRDGMVGGSR